MTNFYLILFLSGSFSSEFLMFCLVLFFHPFSLQTTRVSDKSHNFHCHFRCLFIGLREIMQTDLSKGITSMSKLLSNYYHIQMICHIIFRPNYHIYPYKQAVKQFFVIFRLQSVYFNVLFIPSANCVFRVSFMYIIYIYCFHL